MNLRKCLNVVIVSLMFVGCSYPPSVYQDVGEIREMTTVTDMGKTYPIWTVIKTPNGTYLGNGSASGFDFGKDLKANNTHLKCGPWAIKRIYENPPYQR